MYLRSAVYSRVRSCLILRVSMASLCDQMHAALQAPAGAFQSSTWPEDAPSFAPSTPTRTAQRKRLRLGSASDETDQAAAEAAGQGTGADSAASHSWRQHVRELQTVMDGGLKEALSGALLLLKKPVLSHSRIS